MPFRFQGVQVFLTYSQVGDRSRDSLKEFLRQHSSPVDKFLIGQEQHQDGNTHFHVHLVFSRRYDVRNERIFDWDGCHPNIATIRGRLGGSDARRVHEYCKKGGDYIIWPETATWEFATSKDSKYTKVVNASSRAEAAEVLRNELPRDWVINHEKCNFFLDAAFRPVQSQFISPWTPDDFNVHQTMQQWTIDNLGYV